MIYNVLKMFQSYPMMLLRNKLKPKENAKVVTSAASALYAVSQESCSSSRLGNCLGASSISVKYSSSSSIMANPLLSGNVGVDFPVDKKQLLRNLIFIWSDTKLYETKIGSLKLSLIYIPFFSNWCFNCLISPAEPFLLNLQITNFQHTRTIYYEAQTLI